MLATYTEFNFFISFYCYALSVSHLYIISDCTYGSFFWIKIFYNNFWVIIFWNIKCFIIFKEDLKRRDFSINAIAFEFSKQEIYDFFDGIKHIQEKELQTLLNFRYGYGTWDELKEMRRKIRLKREQEVYKQAERKKDFIEALQIGLAVLFILAFIIGLLYFA